MAYRYRKQSWSNYDYKKEASDQPEAVITKARLDHMESGIEANSMELVTVYKSDTRPKASFRRDDTNKRIVLDITFPVPVLDAAKTDTIGGVKAKARTQEDMEVAIGIDDRLYTGILRSPNGSKFKIKVDDNGVLSTEKII